VVRGLYPTDDGSTAHDLVRPVDEDMFWLGTDEAIARGVEQGRREAVLLPLSTREFTDDPVDEAALRRAVGVALASPALHDGTAVRFAWMRDPARRAALLDAVAARLQEHPDAAGRTAEEADEIEGVERRPWCDDLLRRAPELVLAFGTGDGMHTPDDARRTGERAVLTVSGGAALQSFRVALATEGLGSCWAGSTIVAPAVLRRVLDLPPGWQPLGAVAVGVPAEPLHPAPPADPGDGLVEW
jgi:coenzyme F420-0:L-glutamate ligase / coenzyme F420-1:gamma-L-glutamate ligase